MLDVLERHDKLVEVGDVKTHYYDVGEGAPLVLLHGWGLGNGAILTWVYNIEPLSKSFRVVAPDQLGFGLTEIQDQPNYSLAARAEHVVSLMKYLGLGPSHVCGHSQGAWLACYIALKYPELVKKLVIINSGSISMTKGRSIISHPLETPTKESVRASRLHYVKRPTIYTEEMFDLAYEYSIRNFENFKSALEATLGSSERRKTNTSVDGVHISEMLGTIAQPALIVWGGLDDVPLERGVWTLETMKDSQMHVFGDSGHCPYFDHYEEFNEIVATFLNHDAE